MERKTIVKKPAAPRSSATKTSAPRGGSRSSKTAAAPASAKKPPGAKTASKTTAKKRIAGGPRKTAARARAPAGIVEEQLKLVRNSLDDDKAEDVVVVDVIGRTSIADYLVIASGRSQRQVGAIAEHLIERLTNKGHGRHLRIEGMPQNDWVLIDTGDIIIHVFRPEVREFYRLERMWSPDLDEAPSKEQAG